MNRYKNSAGNDDLSSSPALFYFVLIARIICSAACFCSGISESSVEEALIEMYLAGVSVRRVGGVYNGQWIMAATRWVTKVYAPSKPLPRTGY